MPGLIMTVGLPRCGKTTWSQRQGYPVVNPDAIRLAIHGQRFLESAEPLVWAHAKIMTHALFGAGHSHVILDATNTSKHRRDEWINPRWNRYVRRFDTSVALCQKRAMLCGQHDLISVINRMSAELEADREDLLTIPDWMDPRETIPTL